MRFGKFEIFIVRECEYKLDGGAMFGVVPKPLWNPISPADDRNRVMLNCNLLVINTPNGRVLVETGMGDRWPGKEKDRYALKPLVDSSSVLKEIGLKNEDIDAVVISHLHFDHVGGATRLVDGKLKPTFPKAKYFIQKGEWEFAYSANARAKASYRRDDFEPLKESGQLVLIDGDAEIIPGIFGRKTGGHTSHHQIITFESEGQTGIFFADIMPTKNHVSPPWVMGYDHYPLKSCDLKSEWLEKAVNGNWLVVFDHETGVPWGHVKKNAEKKFEFIPLSADSLCQTDGLTAR